MFKNKVNRLITEFHIKKVGLVELIGTNRVSFDKKMKDNSFTILEQNAILSKYGVLLK